jgi:simple sugar transport system permease protein
VSLGLALLTGAFNGSVVVATKLPSFIVTLGTLFIFRGLTIAITRLRTNRTQLGGLETVPGYDFAHKSSGPTSRCSARSSRCPSSGGSALR